MKTGATIALIVGSFLLLAACAAAPAKNQVPKGSFQAVGQPGLNALAPKTTPTDYRLGPFDKVAVRVFQLDELSIPELQLDANGQVVMPQIGSVAMAGLTVREAGEAVAAKLSACCLREPQVLVTLREALSQQVTVTGAVRTSGVISLRGKSTLKSVVAMAGGPLTETADLKNVGVIRYTNGVRTIGRFNLQDISRGIAADPEIMAGDTVVIETSSSKSTLRNVLQALPLTGLFVLF